MHEYWFRTLGYERYEDAALADAASDAACDGHPGVEAGVEAGVEVGVRGGAVDLFAAYLRRQGRHPAACLASRAEPTGGAPAAAGGGGAVLQQVWARVPRWPAVFGSVRWRKHYQRLAEDK
jgi:hypothetical protein